MRVRRNPAPLYGAIFVRNPGRKARRKNSSRRRRNSSRVSLRSRRRNGRKASRRRNSSRVSMRSRSRRRNTSRRAYSRRRRNYGGTRKGMRRRSARRAFMPRRGMARRAFSRRGGRRRNRSFVSATTGGFYGMVGKVPVFGPGLKSAVTAVPRALWGFAGLYGATMAVSYVMEKAGVELPEMLDKFKYTTTGVMGAVIYGLVGKYTKTSKYTSKLAYGAIGVGVVLDIASALSEAGYFGGLEVQGLEIGDSYGDGGAYEVVPIDSLEDVGAIMQDYSDASLGDAYSVGGDMSPQEGQAILSGAPVWRRVFGPTPIRRIHRGGGPVRQSRHAGRPGHRWAWLIRLIGWEQTRKVAALPADERAAVIAEIKSQAMASASAATQPQPQQITDTAGLMGLEFQGLAMDGGMAMGGLMAAGAGAAF